MSGEFNSPGREFAPDTTSKLPAEENFSFAGNPVPAESASPEEVPVRKKTKRGGATGLAGLLLAAAVLTVGAVGMSAPKASAELAATVTDTAVRYEVVVEGEGLSVVLYNDFTHRSAALEESVCRGEFTGLRPNVRYTVAVVQRTAFGERTLSSQRVVTAAEPVLLTEWRGITHECTCDVDGYFHFQMDLIDENHYFSDFTATLTDAMGTVSACVFTEDPTAEQRIDVALHGGLRGNRAEFVVTCKTSDPAAPSGTLELYRATVAI